MSDVGKIVGDVIGGAAPYSGAIEAATNFGNAIVSRIWPDKTKVAEVQAEVQKAIIAGEYASELASITAVNATMVAEENNGAKWYTWRHMIGYAFAAVLINNYILMSYLQKFGVVPIPVPDNVWTAMLVILGAAAAGHSWEQVAYTKSK